MWPSGSADLNQECLPPPAKLKVLGWTLFHMSSGCEAADLTFCSLSAPRPQPAQLPQEQMSSGPRALHCTEDEESLLFDPENSWSGRRLASSKASRKLPWSNIWDPKTTSFFLYRGQGFLTQVCSPLGEAEICWRVCCFGRVDGLYHVLKNHCS